MAKISAIHRNKKRERLIAKYADKRAELKAILANPKPPTRTSTRPSPRTSCPRTARRSRNRCSVTGRRVLIRKPGLSRSPSVNLPLRQDPGVTKSSWQSRQRTPSTNHHLKTQQYPTMAVHDTIGDFLTIIRNASVARKECAIAQHSKMRLALLKILKDEGYIADLPKAPTARASRHLRSNSSMSVHTGDHRHRASQYARSSPTACAKFPVSWVASVSPSSQPRVWRPRP